MNSRLIITFLLLISFCTIKADSVKDRLQEAYKLYFQEDEIGARDIINQIPEKLISIQNDTLRFQYYYLKADLIEIPSEYGSEYNDAMSVRRSCIEYALNLLETKLSVHNSQYLELLSALADYHKLFDGDIDKAIIAYEKALVLGMYPKAMGDESTNYWYGNIFWQLASLYELKGYEKQLVSLYQNVANVLPAGSDIPPYMGYILLAAYYDKQGRYLDALDANRTLLAMVEKSDGKRGVNYVQTLKSIGSNQSKAKLYGDAITTLQSALIIAENDTTCSGEIFGISAELCLAYIGAKDRAKEAEIYAELVSEAKRSSATDNYINLTFSCADAHLDLNEYALAREYNNNLLSLEKVLQRGTLSKILFQRSRIELGADAIEDGKFFANWASEIASSDDCKIPSDDKIEIHLHLANIYNSANDFDKCLETLDRIVDLYSANLANDDRIFNYIVGYMGSCHIGNRDYDSARNLYHTYMTEILDESNKDWIADAQNKAAVVELLDNKPLEAIKLLDLSWAYYKEAVGENTEQHFLYLHNKGRAYMLQGQKKNALRCLTQSKEIQLALKGDVMERTQMYIDELSAK